MTGDDTQCPVDTSVECNIVCQISEEKFCTELEDASLGVCPRTVKAGVLKATLRGRHMNVAPANVKIRLPDGTVDSSLPTQIVKADGTLRVDLTFEATRQAGTYAAWAEDDYGNLLTGEFAFQVR